MIIVGGGDFAREVVAWIRHHDSESDIIGYVDDAGDKEAMSIPYLGTLSTIDVPDAEFVCTISDPAAKREAVSAMKSRGARFATFVHKSAIVMGNATIGEGVIIGPNSVVSGAAVLGNFVTLNCYTGVGHDARIGDFATLSSFIDVTGWVQIGEGAFVGSQVSLLPKVVIGENARVGAGCVVVRNVPAGATVYSEPARRLS